MAGYRLTQTQLRKLSIEVRPANFDGNTVLVPNPDRKPYRFSDASKGAPIGFGVYVGPRKVFYEVRVKKDNIVRYISLGSVQEIDLDDAHSLANEKRKFIKETGKDPEIELRKRAQAQEAEKITLGEAFAEYIADLGDRTNRGKMKASSFKATQDVAKRFDGGNLLAKRVVDLNDELVKAEFYRIRHQSMLQSKLLAWEVKSLLSGRKEWWHLSKEQLVEMGLTGKTIEQAHSAGLSGAERAMMFARTAIDQLIERDRERAGRDKTPPVFYHNPFDFLAKKDFFRSKKELNRHYEDAEVRNPLSVDGGYVQSFMKALLERREKGREDRRVATDYLFLTMLWGSRRNESATLRWWESLSRDEIRQNLASWLWLTDDETKVNPHTKCRGSQVFFHDTKNGQHLLLPVCPFAKRILTLRREDQVRIRKETSRLRDHTNDVGRRAVYERLLGFNERWVFPAQKKESKIGHYTVSNAIFHNLRIDTGLLDPEADTDIGLAPHDLRRTLGRFAGRILPGHIVSQLLNHKNDDDEKMSFMTERYSQQEWPTLREAMEKVEASIIETSPRVWNALKSSTMPAMDERDDPPLAINLYNRPNGYDTKTQSCRRRSFPERKAGRERKESARAD